LAAIAPVGAAMPKTMACLPSRPMSVVMINGKSDPIVPFGGGREHNLDLSTISVGRQRKDVGQDESLLRETESI
jgi:poly(3-hydroxybutyrate) depolymerase